MITKIVGAVAAVAISSVLFDVPYMASDGSLHLYKETPDDYKRRHNRLARERQMRRYSSKPYKASDGRFYTRKETPAEYYARKARSGRW